MIQPWGKILGGFRSRIDDIAEGILRIRVSSRLSRATGMLVCVYWVNGVLIDTGFAHGRSFFLQKLRPYRLRSICLTHHHEDHSGNAAALAVRHGCPIYLRNPHLRFEEGLSDLRAYRLAWWGEPQAYEPLEMPQEIETEEGELLSIPIPGHSASHTAFFDPKTDTVFVGDLFVSPGVTAVMSHENPFESIRSLRTVAELSPKRMLTGHGLYIKTPQKALRKKADAIEAAAIEVLHLHRQGALEAEIVPRIFLEGQKRDWFFRLITTGEFSRINFVRAVVANQNDAAVA